MALITRSRVEDFLYHEARLMDENRYEEWLALWTEDCRYWIPSNADEIDPSHEVSIIWADRARLGDQIARLLTGEAHAQQPASRLRRLISNVEVSEGEAEDECVAVSNFLLTELRRSRQRTFAGRSFHTLRLTEGGFAIRYKKVELVNNNEVLDNLTFLI